MLGSGKGEETRTFGLGPRGGPRWPAAARDDVTGPGGPRGGPWPRGPLKRGDRGGAGFGPEEEEEGGAVILGGCGLMREEGRGPFCKETHREKRKKRGGRKKGGDVVKEKI